MIRQLVIDTTNMHPYDIEEIKKIADRSKSPLVEQKVYGIKSIMTITADVKKKE
jgi:hypothetical protein